MSQSFEDSFPLEPFPCPNCGQMLASRVRVCVACKQPVDPARVARTAAVLVASEAQAQVRELVRFPWFLFVLFLVVRLAAATVVAHKWGLIKVEVALGVVEFLTAGWVFADAQRRRVPKPLRWALGCLLLWVIFLPWYLERRRKPQAICPLVENPLSPFARVLLVVIIALILLAATVALLNGPPKP